jgi:co-chaperonin GroES (HSP10)
MQNPSRKTKGQRSGKRVQLLVVGDRVLIEPDEGEARTEVGLYLPKWAVEKESVQGGRIIATGPGTPLPDFKEMDDEPWRPTRRESRHMPMQARKGDYAIFLRKAAVEIKVDNKNYLVVPQGAILVLMRDQAHLNEDG